MYAAPFAWKELQKDVKLHDTVPLEAFKECWMTWRQIHLFVDVLPDFRIRLSLYVC